MKKIYIVNGSEGYSALFKRMGYEIAQDLDNVSLVCFTGGSDVTPSLYGHSKHASTFNNVQRDQYEADIFQLCVERSIPMVGICRGAQFLNVMSGGEMYQDVSYHTRDHLITDLETGESVWVSSTHHQMMKPTSKAVLVATGSLKGERTWWDNGVFNKDTSNEDIEVVYYEDTQCLCFQPHPEFMGENYRNMHTYFASLVERFLVKKHNHVGCTC